MTDTQANGYPSDSTQWELSNKFQHDRVWMVFRNLCILVLWTKVALALEGLGGPLDIVICIYDNSNNMLIIKNYCTKYLKESCCCWLILQRQNDAKNLKNDWNPATWVLSWEVSNKYQHNRVFKNDCILVIWTKVASALEGLRKCKVLEVLNWTVYIHTIVW